MPQRNRSTAASRAARANKRISISSGNALYDLGMVADLPEAVLQFYRFLDCDGERLNDREMMPLVMIIALKEGLDGQGLRLADLPSTAPLDTLRRYLAKWERMGLVFTRNIDTLYSEARECQDGNPRPNPQLKHVVYDLSNLMFNISLIAQEHARRSRDMLTRWEQGGGAGERPIYQLPDDYVHPVRLAPEVAAWIVDQESGVLCEHIVPQWHELARKMVDETDETPGLHPENRANKIGRASCRERV